MKNQYVSLEKSILNAPPARVLEIYVAYNEASDGIFVV